MPLRSVNENRLIAVESGGGQAQLRFSRLRSVMSLTKATKLAGSCSEAMYWRKTSTGIWVPFYAGGSSRRW